MIYLKNKLVFSVHERNGHLQSFSHPQDKKNSDGYWCVVMAKENEKQIGSIVVLFSSWHYIYALHLCVPSLFLAVMRFGYVYTVSYISWISLLSALMPVKPKAASCRQYHQGDLESNRIGHSSIRLFQGTCSWSKSCCMVHEHFHSAHLETISWMSELSCQPR